MNILSFKRGFRYLLLLFVISTSMLHSREPRSGYSLSYGIGMNAMYASADDTKISSYLPSFVFDYAFYWHETFRVKMDGLYMMSHITTSGRPIPLGKASPYISLFGYQTLASKLGYNLINDENPLYINMGLNGGSFTIVTGNISELDYYMPMLELDGEIGLGEKTNLEYLLSYGFTNSRVSFLKFNQIDAARSYTTLNLLTTGVGINHTIDENLSLFARLVFTYIRSGTASATLNNEALSLPRLDTKIIELRVGFSSLAIRIIGGDK